MSFCLNFLALYAKRWWFSYNLYVIYHSGRSTFAGFLLVNMTCLHEKKLLEINLKVYLCRAIKLIIFFCIRHCSYRGEYTKYRRCTLYTQSATRREFRGEQTFSTSQHKSSDKKYRC